MRGMNGTNTHIDVTRVPFHYVGTLHLGDMGTMEVVLIILMVFLSVLIWSEWDTYYIEEKDR